VNVIFGSVDVVAASASRRLIIASIGSADIARALGTKVSIFADSADLGWFSGSLALNRWMR